MFKLQKKAIVALIFILTFSILLAACSNSPEAVTNDSNVNKETDKPEPKVDKPTELVELTWMTRPPDNEEQERIRQELIVEPFEKANPHVRLKIIENQDPDMLTRQQLAAGVGPDIIIVDGPTTLLQFASAGYLLPLDNYSELYGWKDVFYDWAYETGFYKDQLYGLPGSYESLVVWYNKDMFEENGWVEPRTFDELLSLSKKIQDSGIMPFAFGTTDFRPSNEWWLSVVYNSYLGADEFKKVLKNEVPWTSDLIKEATQTWVDIWQKGYINNKQSHAISLDDAWFVFDNKQAAMKMEGTWTLDRIVTNPPPFEMDFFVMPSWREGVEPTLPMALGEAIGINSKSKYPDETAAFLDFYYGTKRAESELGRGSFLPVNGLNIEEVEVLNPLVMDVYEELNQAFIAGNSGYASWTYWPPRAQQYLWDHIDAVFLGQLSIDDYLLEAQKRADEDAEEGMLFKFSD
jgi:raffinose/stachyose/melibiose transport system substrate-binding protein